jgi:high-affinity Fe2+/Pb2+ permease
MVSVLQIRIIGTAVLVLGMLIFLYGLLTLAKNVIATSFIAIIIAVTLLYYARRMGDRPQ